MEQLGSHCRIFMIFGGLRIIRKSVGENSIVIKI
jgi:hypothetical protein